MARLISDQNKLSLFYESGTYANTSGLSGVWLGLIQDHAIEEKQNIIETRFLGQVNRNVGIFNPGKFDVVGQINYFPQDWRMLGFFLGSISTTSGTNNTFSMSEVNTGQTANAFTSGTFNPWISFSIEESRTSAITNQNFVRTIRGAHVEQFMMDISTGAPVKVQLGIVAQIGSWTSGNSSPVVAGSNRPYLWSDASFQLNGVNQDPVTSIKADFKNSFVMPHYVNGSRVSSIPYPLNRDYKVTALMDMEATLMGSYYNTLFLGGSKFNAVIDLNNSGTNTADTGSHHLILTLSGCKMTVMQVPAKISKINEVTMTFVPGSVSAQVWDILPTYTLF